MNIPKTYTVVLAGHTRTLPVVQVAPGVHISVLTLIGDAELTEAAGKALGRMVPPLTDVLVMPDGKAQCLLHVVQRETGKPAVLARKQKKVYMMAPVLTTPAVSITSPEKHTFHLSADDVEKIKGRRVAIIDDVVSTGGTIRSMIALLKLAGAADIVILAVGTEGEKQADLAVMALHHFPVYLE